MKALKLRMLTCRESLSLYIMTLAATMGKESNHTIDRTMQPYRINRIRQEIYKLLKALDEYENDLT